MGLGIPDRLESLLANPIEGGSREGFGDIARLLTSSFLSGEILGFKRGPLKGAPRRAAAAADEPTAAATAAAGKLQQTLDALNPFLVNMKDLHKQINIYPLLKTERCIPRKVGFRV